MESVDDFVYLRSRIKKTERDSEIGKRNAGGAWDAQKHDNTAVQRHSKVSILVLLDVDYRPVPGQAYKWVLFLNAANGSQNSPSANDKQC